MTHCSGRRGKDRRLIPDYNGPGIDSNAANTGSRGKRKFPAAERRSLNSPRKLTCSMSISSLICCMILSVGDLGLRCNSAG